MKRTSNKNYSYTPDDVLFITENHSKLSDSAIAFRLRRTTDGIIHKRKELGFKKPQGRLDHQDIRLNIIDIEDEVIALINFIETTKSTVWRDIANTRRKSLIKEISELKTKLK